MKLNKLLRLSHDIRSSLTSIQEGISLVSDGTLGKINQRQKKCLKIAKEGITRIVSLVDSFSKTKKKGK